MGKNLKGKELGVGLYQRANGLYEARAMINGSKINLYNNDLYQLKADFETAKEKVKLGIDFKFRNITVDEWFDEWFTKYRVPYIKSVSVYPMTSKYKSTFGKEIGEYKMTDVRSIHVQSVINKLSEEGRASSSIREALGTLRRCFESARNNRIIDTNPCFEIQVPWERKNVMRRFLTEEEQQEFLETAEGDWYEEMFYVMFLTGLRIGEVGGLMWKDIDFKSKCITAQQAISCSYEDGVKKCVISTLKTQNSYRCIPFMGEIEEKLISQKCKQDKLKVKLGARWRAVNEDFKDLVFTSTMGSPVTRYIAEKMVNKTVDKINLQRKYVADTVDKKYIEFARVYPHAIRHTFCSRCFVKGMEPKVVQMLMGHANYSTTIEIYTHVTQNNVSSEALKFGTVNVPK